MSAFPSTSTITAPSLTYASLTIVSVPSSFIAYTTIPSSGFSTGIATSFVPSPSTLMLMVSAFARFSGVTVIGSSTSSFFTVAGTVAFNEVKVS